MTRLSLLAIALGTLALVWFGPLPSRAAHDFGAHMTMHMGVVAVAAPLLAIGLAGGRFDPARRWPAFFNPIPASIVELIVVWAWHVPALHHAARTSTAGLVTEQGMFLASGLLVWCAACGGPARGRADRTAAGVIALLLTSVHMTLLGALLALSTRPLYAHHLESASTAAALDAQQLGGALMLLVGGASYLAGGLWLSGRLLRSGASSSGAVSPRRPA